MNKVRKEAKNTTRARSAESWASCVSSVYKDDGTDDGANDKRAARDNQQGTIGTGSTAGINSKGGSRAQSIHVSPTESPVASRIGGQYGGQPGIQPGIQSNSQTGIRGSGVDNNGTQVTVAESESLTKRAWHVNPYYFFGFIGITLYAAWLFLSYFDHEPLVAQRATLATDGTVYAVPQLWGMELPGVLTQVAMVALAILALVIAWKASDFLSTNKGKNVLLTLTICTGPLASLSPFLLQLGLGSWVFVPWMLSGLAYAALLLLWSTLLITLEDKQLTIFIASAVIAGAVIYILVTSIVAFASVILVAALPVLSAICFIISLRSRRRFIGRQRALIVVSATESDEKDPINWRVVADTLTYTPCLGIGIWCALHDLSYPQNIICIGLATIVSCLIIIADVRWLHWLSSKMQLKLFLPLAALTVFPLSFLDGTPKMIAVFFLFVVFMLSVVTNYSAISLCVRVFELSPIRVFAYGRAFNLLGVVFGYLFAAVAFSADLSRGEGTGTILAFSALMLLFIIASTFILEDRYPISSDVADDDMDAVPSIPKRDLWDERCAQIAEYYGLSSRQSEVLNLLSKGRNTVYVSEKLVISHYTAKAHIYNIYQKIGIHSRQELLDLIEQVELD
ncbi:MAG: helix-turn-helix transcriptional regulator [Coriobacteriales bacterium]|jgi:DNA-binding CsgD family transcriptional regulator|nr:helix-turn-helix transcriptional regulator [Coriobacteriales bacterium]